MSNIEQLKQAWNNWTQAAKEKDSAWYHIEDLGETNFRLACDRAQKAGHACQQAYLAAYPGKNIADFNDFVIAGPGAYRAYDDENEPLCELELALCR